MKSNYYLFTLFSLIVILTGAIFLISSQLTKPTSIHDKLLAIQNKIPTQSGKNVFLTQSNNLTKKVDPELVELDSQIISCDASVDNLISTGSIGGSCIGGGTTLPNAKGKFLGGQCCGAMTNTKEYHEELKKLQTYKNIPDIPLNPYKTPVELAKKWIDYDKDTSLSADEQKIMDEAMKMSKEGPCCCKCWHYYVNEGIAKKMIRDKGWNAKQIADYWDTSSIC